MKKIRFLFYYLDLRLKVALGVHKTSNPLGIKWRWNHWRNRESLIKRGR